MLNFRRLCFCVPWTAISPASHWIMLQYFLQTDLPRAFSLLGCFSSATLLYLQVGLHLFSLKWQHQDGQWQDFSSSRICTNLSHYLILKTSIFSLICKALHSTRQITRRSSLTQGSPPRFPPSTVRILFPLTLNCLMSQTSYAIPWQTT